MSPSSRQKGTALLVVMVLFVALSLSIAAGLVTPVIRAHRVATDVLDSKQAYFLAESGDEDVLYRLLNAKQVGASNTLVLGTETATTTVTDMDNGDKEIQSLGDAEDRDRTVALTVSQGAGVSFNYGVQVGQGGLVLTGSSGINGNVYANGSIQGTSSSFITGSAVAANSAPLAADQSNSTGAITDIPFGNANATQDIAESFTVSTASPLNKVQLYLKKVGSPSNATVYIVADSGGVPGTTTLAQATLSASLVGTSYGWVDALFTTTPTLQTGVTYWLVVDASTASSKYYVIGANTGGYATGTGKIGQYKGTWNGMNPSNLDIYFNLYTGGQIGQIFGSSGSQWNQFRVGTGGTGSADAQVVNYTNATGTIYCQTGTGNNKACTTSQSVPTAQPWPISESNVASWEDEAAAGTVVNGNVSLTGVSHQSIGPEKIVGNLSVGNSAVLTVTGTLWVTGNLTVDGAGAVHLSSAYGGTSGVIVVDGTVTIAGSSPVTGSGTNGSYIMIVSLSDCPTSSSCSGSDAINISGAAGAVVLVAQNGTIAFSGSASARQATGYSISLSGSTTVTYDSGLANMNFSSGPSGSWNIESWRETQ
ncbi:MAG TPA: choice-of-anchor R domain-containing protein [Candidatus Paceibacterota bacterium]|nr:choice-of-anchor R domain-containing protein [Candidatus Paceibacterota bacterium]